VGIAGLSYGLPRQVRELDERYVVAGAVGFFTGDWNPHLFRYPALFLYIVHFALRPIAWWWSTTGFAPDTAHLLARYDLDPTPFTLVARGLALASAAATASLAAAIGARLGGAKAGLAAGVVLALSPLAAEMARYARVDAFMVLLVTASLFLATRFQMERRARDAVLMSLCAGLAIGTKYPAVFVLFAVWAAVLLVRRDVVNRNPSDRPFGARFLASPRGALLLFAALPAAVFFASSPFILLDRAAFADEMRWIAPLVTKPFGKGRYSQGLFVYPRFLIGPAFGAGFLVAAIAGTMIALRRRAGLVLPLLAFAIPYVAFFVIARTRYERFLLPILPVLAVFAGIALAEAARRVRLPLAIVLAAAFVPTAPFFAGRLIAAATNGETRLRALSFIEATIPGGGVILFDEEQSLPPVLRRDTKGLAFPELARTVARKPALERATLSAIAALRASDSRPRYRVFPMDLGGGLPAATTMARTLRPALIVVSKVDANAIAPDLLEAYSIAAEFPPAWGREGPSLTLLVPRDSGGGARDSAAVDSVRGAR
jgi:hypothetical protein